MDAIRKFLRKYDRLVITGGSSGIGQSFIELTKKLDGNLKVCNLSRTKPSVFSQPGFWCHINSDLSSVESVQNAWPELQQWLADHRNGRGILLINNSGFGAYGRLCDHPRDHLLNMIDLNIRGVVDLTHRMMPMMLESGGHVINVASIAGRQPTPYMAVYGASKAFVIHWSLSIDQEYARQGVRSTALCPGPTESRFFERAGFEEAPLNGFGHKADYVVKVALKAAAAGRPIVVSGLLNKITTVLGARLPLTWQAALAAMVMRKMRLQPGGSKNL